MNRMNSSRKTRAWKIEETGMPRWIFPIPSRHEVNLYTDFLHVFECRKAPRKASIRISADTDFVLWINGNFAGFNQYPNYPESKTYEEFNLGSFIRTGRNILSITMFYNGRTSSVYQRGRPGIVFEITAGETAACSGTETMHRPNPCYHSGPIAIVSNQLSFTFGYDARGEDGFNCSSYEPTGEWKHITEAETSIPAGRAILYPRPVKRLTEEQAAPASLKEAGLFKYNVTGAAYDPATADSTAGLTAETGAVTSPAELMQHAELCRMNISELSAVSPSGAPPISWSGRPSSGSGSADGIYLLFDLGLENAGYIDFEVTACAGTIIDIGYGEHLEDGRPRTLIDERHFAGRYICRGGNQSFTHYFLRWAGRYLQLNIQSFDFTLQDIGLKVFSYRVTNKGSIRTDSRLHSRIIGAGRRTLRLCMHEHYEDTPWREQALYANDARIQALCGYYAFGEYQMPAASFSLLGEGIRDDGYLNLTAPALPPVTIPSFTFAWILAVRDHFLYSGDNRLARRFLPQIISMLRGFLTDRKNGLLTLSRTEGVWHFYDWSAGMSGYSGEALAAGLLYDAPLNCYLVMAIDAAMDLLKWSGEDSAPDIASAAEAVRNRIAQEFWNPEEDAFKTCHGSSTMTELTQALAVLAKAGDENIRGRALSRMARPDSGLAGAGLSQSFYTFEALMTRPELFAVKVLDRIEHTWGSMLDAGATTFWETHIGAGDFNKAGSLCHGWSAVPVYVFYHDILGIQPLAPGFSLFAARPAAGTVSSCSGSVPTPEGRIRFEWEDRGSGGLLKRLEAPQKLVLDGSHGIRASLDHA